MSNKSGALATSPGVPTFYKRHDYQASRLVPLKFPNDIELHTSKQMNSSRDRKISIHTHIYTFVNTYIKNTYTQYMVEYSKNELYHFQFCKDCV